MFRALPLFILLLLALPVYSLASAPTLTFAIHSSACPGLDRPGHWQFVKDALKLALPDHEISVIILDHQSLAEQMITGQIDFVLTSPGHYLRLKRQANLSSPLATTIRQADGLRLSTTGGVIVAHADNAAIVSLKDLKNVTVATVRSSCSFCYLPQISALGKLQLRPDLDYRLVRSATLQKEVLEQVTQGEVDAGFVPVGILEHLERNGLIDLDRLRIINPQADPAYPLLRSTELFPEWPVAALPHVDDTIARRVGAALLLAENRTLAEDGNGIYGFTIPKSYAITEDVLRDLRLPPFDQRPTIRMADILSEYWLESLLMAALVLVLLQQTWWLRRINRRMVDHRQTIEKQADALRVSEKRLKDIIQGTQAGTWEWHLDTDRVILNERWAQLLGYPDSTLTLTTKEYTQLIHPEDAERCHTKMNHHLTGDTDFFECELRLRRNNGHWVWVAERGQVVERDTTGQPVLMTGIIIDISTRKQAEEALQQKTTEMEEFVYSVSHDLKSPVITIKAFLSILRKNVDSNDIEAVLSYLDYIGGAADKMEQFINALLQLSRTGGLGDNRQHIDAAQLVDSILAGLASQIQEHQVKIDVHNLGCQLLGDPLRLGQIWQNLLENAIKYRHPDRVPEVVISSEQRDGEIIFTVQDNGAGIAPQHRERIFQVFAQLDPQQDGQGLGLALVKKIVTSYQGRIWIETPVTGQGSRFCFTLPAALKQTAVS